MPPKPGDVLLCRGCSVVKPTHYRGVCRVCYDDPAKVGCRLPDSRESKPRKKCPGCGRMRVEKGCGLCAACWADKSVRETVGTDGRTRPRETGVECRGCGRVRAYFARGLCRRCWSDPATRGSHGKRNEVVSKNLVTCAACGRERGHRDRGLCWDCHARVDVRDRYGRPDRRFKALDRKSVAERRAVLEANTADLRRAIRAIAAAVAGRFGGRLRANLTDDLEQVGWVAAIRAADRFDAATGHKFVNFAWFGIKGMMCQYAARQAAEWPIGAAGVDFDCPGRAV